MALATWWAGDSLPTLDPLPGFRAAIIADIDAMARLVGLEPTEVRARLDGGHRPYVATLHGIPAGYGWVAGADATIGELGVLFVLPRGDRYLWDFATLPAWRGQGIYPHLLQGIIAAEAAGAARLWIIHTPENRASCQGIARADFAPVGELSFRADGSAGFRPADRQARARVGAALLGVPLLDADGEMAEPLAPCWHCAIEAARHDLSPSAAACWVGSDHDTPCRCTA